MIYVSSAIVRGRSRRSRKDACVGAVSLLFAVFGLSVAGCAQERIEVVSLRKEKGDSAVVFSHWHQNEAFGEYLEAVIDGPLGSVDVQARVFPKDRYHLELTTQMLADQAPDVLMLSEQRVVPYVENHWLAELESVWDAYGVRTSSTLASLEEARFHDYLRHTVPFTVATYRLVYNRRLFRDSGIDPDRPPRTVAELVDAAELIGERLGPTVRAFALPLAEGIEAFRENLEVSALNSGIEHVRTNPVTYDLSTYEPWIRAINRMDAEKLLLPGWKNLSKLGAIENFLRENVAMLVANSDDLAALRRGRSLDIGVAPVPALLEPTGEGVTRLSSVLAVNAESESKSDSMLVCLTAFESQQHLLRSEIAMSFAALKQPIPRWRWSAPLSFRSFFPTEAEVLKLFPQYLYDSPFLYDGFRMAVQGDPDRVTAILGETSAVCRLRLVQAVGDVSF